MNSRIRRSLVAGVISVLALLVPLRAGAQLNCSGYFTESGAAGFWTSATEAQVRTCIVRLGVSRRSKAWAPTPLHLAVMYTNEPAVVSVLLEGGADPNAKNIEGETPLHVAALHTDEPAVVSILLEGGADPNAKNIEGETPLHVAALHTDEPAIVSALLEYAADPNASNDAGETPLQYAKHNKALSDTWAYRQLSNPTTPDSPDSGEDDYRAIQGMLNKAGLDAGPEDGQWGPASRRALRAFQASKGLPETGMPDQATLTVLRAAPDLLSTCGVGMELGPGQGCRVPDAGTFSVRADGCVDEMPSFPNGSTPGGRALLSIGRMNSTFSGGKSQSCMSGHLGIGPFRASEISGTSRWRIDALPGAAPGRAVEGRQDQQRAEETRDRLFSSIIAGDHDGVMRAIEEGANVNDLVDASDLKGASALLVAVSQGNAEIVRMLVGAGADASHVLPEQDPWSKATGGTSALAVAVDKEYTEIVRMLVEAGADVNRVLPGDKFGRSGSMGSTVLFKAVYRGNAEIVRILVEAGADANHVLPQQRVGGSASGMSALLLAVDKEHVGIVRLLVGAGAHVNYVLPREQFSRAGRAGSSVPSALLAAVLRGNAKIVRILVEAGADANYVFPEQGFSKNSGVSALILAAAKGDEEITHLLIEAGANVNYQIPESVFPARTAGLTALRGARAQNHKGIVKLLKKAGARR